MATIQFKGKEIVRNHHLTVPYHELVPDGKKSLTKKVSLNDNLIIHGDNLLALKALLPSYAGKVKCIYIDPPYNIGNEKWAYNDNVNSPMMKEWLGKVVDKDDLTRHDKWLCMMMPRLKLLRELLSEDGVIFISIGDDEAARLKCLLDEIFTENNFIAQFTWKSRAKPTNTGNARYRPQRVAEYVFSYSKKSPEEIFFNIGTQEERRYPNQDKLGNYRTTTILTSNRGTFKRETMRFKINGFTPNEDQRWKAGYDEVYDLFKTGRIGFKDGVPSRKHYESDEEEMLYPLYTFMDEVLSGTAEQGKSDLNMVIGTDHGFDTVKPVNLIKYLISLCGKKDESFIVLDSFSGSGTTAQAVIELNKEDGVNRKFIMVEMEDYADKITAERVRRVIKGVKGAKDENLQKGLGGSFSYYELGKPIDVERVLKGKDLPSFMEMARYVFYTATGEEFNEKKANEKTGLIGESKGYHVYLLYKPDMKYLKSTALTLERAEALGKFAGKKRLVFAPAKYLDQEHLERLHIDFAQLPFEIYQKQ